MLARFVLRASAPAVLAAWTILLGAAAAVLCGCGCPARPLERPQTAGVSSTRAPRDLLSLGTVGRDADGEVVSLRLRGSDVTDAELQQLANFGRLSELTVQECRVSADGLAALTSLRELELHCPEIRIESLRSLVPPAQLDSLNTIGTPLGPAGTIKALNKLLPLCKVIILRG